jgi:nesprin-1
MQLHLFHQILVKQESLEAGQIEIGQWLDEAEALLASHSLAGGKELVQALLDKHKVKQCSVCSLECFSSKKLYFTPI